VDVGDDEENPWGCLIWRKVGWHQLC